MDGDGVAQTRGEIQRPGPTAALWRFNQACDGRKGTGQRVVSAAWMWVDLQIQKSPDIADQITGQDGVFIIEQGLVGIPQPLGSTIGYCGIPAINRP